MSNYKGKPSSKNFGKLHSAADSLRTEEEDHSAGVPVNQQPLRDDAERN